MAEGSGTGMRIRASSVPFFPEVRALVEKEIIPGGLIRNRQFREKQIEIGPGCPDWLVNVFFDPQTSGGLLIALPEAAAEGLLRKMHVAGIAEAAIVGEVTAAPAGKIRVE
jgi:selenide,water dikinase